MKIHTNGIKILFIMFICYSSLVFGSQPSRSKLAKYTLMIKKMPDGTTQHISNLFDSRTGEYVKRKTTISTKQPDGKVVLVNPSLDTNMPEDSSKKCEMLNLLNQGELCSLYNVLFAQIQNIKEFSHESSYHLPSKQDEGKK